jgi:hypothetical protein
MKIGEAIGSVTGCTGFVCGLWLAHGWIRDLESGTEGFAYYYCEIRFTYSIR